MRYHARGGGFIGCEIYSDVIPGCAQRSRGGGADSTAGAGDDYGGPDFVWHRSRIRQDSLKTPFCECGTYSPVSRQTAPAWLGKSRGLPEVSSLGITPK